MSIAREERDRPRRTWWPAGVMMQTLFIPVRGRQLLRVVLVGLLLTLLTPALTSNEEEPTHDLRNRTLCVDPTSVMVQLEGFGQSRAAAVRPNLSRQLDRQLRRSLADGGLEYNIAASCRASDAFVTLNARISVLDAQTYRHYGPQAFGYALELQVGTYAEESRRLEEPLLPDQRFEAFDEDVYSEAKHRARIESYVETRAQTLLDALVTGWQMDAR